MRGDKFFIGVGVVAFMDSLKNEIPMKPYYFGLVLMVLLVLVSFFFGPGDMKEVLSFFLMVALLGYFISLGISIKYRSKITLLISSIALLSFILVFLSSFSDKISDIWYFPTALGISVIFTVYYIIKIWKMKK